MLIFIMAMFCIFPAIAGVYVYKKIDKTLHPYIYTIWLAVIVEIVARWAFINKNAIVFGINYNLFMQINFALCLWLFFNLKIVNIKTAISIFFIVVTLKCIELFYVNSWQVLRIASIAECCITIFFSTKALSNILLLSSEKLIKSTLFIVLIVLIILNLFDILNTILGWLIPISKNITATTTTVFIVVNAICYLTITYAFLCTVPNKK